MGLYDISEYCFEHYLKERNGIYYIYVLLLITFDFILKSFLDVIEKYLLEVDYINSFQLVMLEGIFGLIYTSIYSIIENPFKEAKDIYDTNEKKYFIFLIIGFVIYFITSGGRNIYRVITNKLYSPMARTLTDSFLDPLFIIYYFIVEKDFSYSNNTQNFYYFIINLLISFIIVFFGCVYNELFVLYCCNLEHDTYHQISRRASLIINDKSCELVFDVDDNYYTTIY